MGRASENSIGGWKNTISTMIKDTYSATLGAFVDIFIKDDNSDSASHKDTVELENKELKINSSTLETKVEGNISIEKYFYENFHWESKFSPDMNNLMNMISFSTDTKSDSLLSIQQYGNGEGKIIDVEIVSKFESISELASELRKDTYIVDQLKDNGFEVNDKTITSFAIFHEVGHYHLTEKFGSEISDKIDELNSKIEIGFRLQFAMNDNLDGYYENMGQIYRELPEEHYADEFAIHAMNTYYENDGEMKIEPDVSDIPEIDIRTTIEDYANIFEEIAFDREEGESYFQGMENMSEEEIADKLSSLNTEEVYEKELEEYLKFSSIFDDYKDIV